MFFLQINSAHQKLSCYPVKSELPGSSPVTIFNVGPAIKQHCMTPATWDVDLMLG